nr:hypothetical protein [Eubacterium sp.]
MSKKVFVRLCVIFSVMAAFVTGMIFMPRVAGVVRADDESSESVTITLDLNGGSYDGETIFEIPLYSSLYYENYYIGSDITYPDGSKVLSGWRCSEDSEENIYSNWDVMYYSATSDTTFVAVWEDAVKATFISEEGYYDGDENTTSVEVLNKKDNYLDYYTVVTPYGRDGFAFAGYTVDGDDTLYVPRYNPLFDGQESIYAYTITEDTVFTAVWVPIIHVNFESELGYIDGYEDQTNETMEIGEGMPLNQYVYCSDTSDKTFLGWKLKGSDSDVIYNDFSGYNDEYIPDGYADFFTYIVNEEVTFEAVWGDPYVVTFKSEYGLNLDETVKEVKNNVKPGWTLYNNYPYSYDTDDYIFDGWQIEGDASGLKYRDFSDIEALEGYADINSVVVNNNMTFVAVWVKSCKVSFHSDLGYIFGYETEKDTYYKVEEGEKYSS